MADSKYLRDTVFQNQSKDAKFLDFMLLFIKKPLKLLWEGLETYRKKVEKNYKKLTHLFGYLFIYLFVLRFSAEKSVYLFTPKFSKK